MEITIDDSVLNRDTEQWLVQFVKDVMYISGVNSKHETMRIFEYDGKRVYLIADDHEIDSGTGGDYTIRTWDYKKTPKSEKALQKAEEKAKPGDKVKLKLSEHVTWTLFTWVKGSNSAKEVANNRCLIEFNVEWTYKGADSEE